MQKGVGVKVETDQASAFGDAGAVEGFDRRFGLALAGAEAGKIVFAFQQRGGAAHGGGIERVVRPAGAAGQQRRPYRRGGEQVAVAAGAGVETGMEMRVGFLHLQHRHAGGQQGVDAAHPCLLRAYGVAVEMDGLRQRVHAGVGAAGGGYRNGMAGDARERVFQRGLDGGRVAGLFLPAEKAAAVVGKGKGVAGHGLGMGQPEKGGLVFVLASALPFWCAGRTLRGFRLFWGLGCRVRIAHRLPVLAFQCAVLILMAFRLLGADKTTGSLKNGLRAFRLPAGGV